MNTRELAQKYVDIGCYVFPLTGKTPLLTDWPNEASQDPAKLDDWFVGKKRSAGVVTGKFRDGKALIVIDVDVKNGKRGDSTILDLELEGFVFPPTLKQHTPSGGYHLFYWNDHACKQGVDKLGEGVDIRSRGGFVVVYEYNDTEIAKAPDWLVEKLGSHGAVAPRGLDKPIEVQKAISRGQKYLETALVAVEGQGGDATTFKVAAALKDIGCDEKVALGLMIEHWNPKCSPPWEINQLAQKVANAYNYGEDAVGSSAPENVFEPVVEGEVIQKNDIAQALHPLEVLNKTYFYIAGGKGAIMQETHDLDGLFELRGHTLEGFKTTMCTVTIQHGKREEELGKAWLKWQKRRSYDRMVFAPNRKVPNEYYNLWRGFSVNPAATPHHPMVERWKEHLLENICQGDKDQADWLTCWFAHLVQHPEQKPLVGIVLRGGKGVGKNILVEMVGTFLGCHALLVSQRRYLVSNYNAHFQNCLLFVLDEAFWSGDKGAEGALKDLVTGTHHVIEKKFSEVFKVHNLTRVVIIGNEEWLVPASGDERRWAVFDVGEGKKQNNAYFEEMKHGLEKEGGNRHLLRYLLDYNITKKLNEAPKTEALLEQKHASLDPLEQWWYDVLCEGELVGSTFGDEWPEIVACNAVYDAYERYVKSRNMRSRCSSIKTFNKKVKQMAVSVVQKLSRSTGKVARTFTFPPLPQARKDWELFIGQQVKWEN